jgi:hypothetical protein
LLRDAIGNPFDPVVLNPSRVKTTVKELATVDLILGQIMGPTPVKRRWRLRLGLGLLLLVAYFLLPWVYYLVIGWIYGVAFVQPADDPPFNHPLARLEKDDRLPFRLDPEKAYRIELGRGSGWHGLDIVKFSQDGSVVLHSHRGTIWYTATMHLPEQAAGQVFQAVEDNQLLGMERAYHANVADGTQWVLWIKQGNNEKSVYFNNHFPKGIIGFANALDTLLSGNGVGSVSWRPVRSWSSRNHEKELWNSIKR